MQCEFINQLSRLRKLSAESVDNIDAFDIFKRYLHVDRQIERELRDILRSVNQEEGKCLLLLCGSAGDGKSHLMSYLKNYDDEQLLTDFELYNDATESLEPKLTSIDTLAIKLQSFNDDNYLANDGKKVIIAINLGTLNNFIESEKGKNFSKLKEYVEANGIFSTYTKKSIYKENSVFQHVSFSDYQVFSLSKDGYETSFLEALIEKVFLQSDGNPFFASYLKCDNCSLRNRCPVRHNYEFLSDVKRQKVIIKRIVESVIKDKAIVSTREVLNLIYDLIVHPDFRKKDISVGTSDVLFLSHYISWTTPMLLNEYQDVSPFLNDLKQHDVLRERTIVSDENATRFHSLENIHSVFSRTTDGTPYHIINKLTDVSELGAIKPELKKILYRFIARLEDFEQPYRETRSSNRMKEYIKYLYYQNIGEEMKLRNLYDATKKAILGWDGLFEGDYICIDNTNDHYWVLERLQLRYAPEKRANQQQGNIERFSPTIELGFARDGFGETNTAKISLDFALFELVSDMKEGYRPTVKDRNRHTDFVSFVQRVIEFGNKSNQIVLIPKGNSTKERMVFDNNGFGYEFKVMGQ